MATALGMLMAALVSFVMSSRDSIILLSFIFTIAIFLLARTKKAAKLHGTKI